MKKITLRKQTARIIAQQEMKANRIPKRLLDLASKDKELVLQDFNTSLNGLCEAQVIKQRQEWGDNTITHEKKDSLAKRLAKAFINPFTIVLFVLAAFSVFADIILAGPGEADFTTVAIVLTMVTMSGMLCFVQEARSSQAAERLSAMVKITTCVQRALVGKVEIPLEEVVNGDIVCLSAGDMVPADMIIIEAKDLFISESALSGESEPVEKVAEGEKGVQYKAPMECPNLAFMGTNVISGTALGVVVATGDQTLFGNLSKTIIETKTVSNFERGVNSVSWLLIKFMMVMAPVVFFMNGFTKGNWMEALLFALSVAVGLTPERLSYSALT